MKAWLLRRLGYEPTSVMLVEDISFSNPGILSTKILWRHSNGAFAHSKISGHWTLEQLTGSRN